MTQGAASSVRITLAPSGATIRLGPPLPLAAALSGKQVDAVAEFLPRLFNLCPMAQGQAARLSLGLAGIDPQATGQEVIRDHLLKICVTLRGAFGLAPLPLPLDDPAQVLGPSGLPCRLADLAAWQAPVADLVQAITLAFPAGAGCSAALALPDPRDPLAIGAFENSPAGRQAGHPLLQEVAAKTGRGPLWRYLGLLADLEAAIDNRLAPATCADGIARVQAARGVYALRLTQTAGIVTGLARVTPTDHLLAPNGVLRQSLDNLPPSLYPRARQMIALIDPCVPVHVQEVAHA